MDLEIDPVEDQAIISALRTKDFRQAARLMVRYYGNAVYNFCLAQVSEQDLAEDLTYSSFTKAFSVLNTFGGQTSPRTWLMWIAGAVCIQQAKSAENVQQDDLATVELEAGFMDPQKISEALRRRLDVLAAAL